MTDSTKETGEGIIKREDLPDKSRLYVEYLQGRLSTLFKEKAIISQDQVKPDLFTEEERKKVEKCQEDIYYVLKTGELPKELQLDAFKKELNEFLERYKKGDIGIITSFLERERANGSIPKLKPELFLFNENMLQRIFSEIPNDYKHYNFAGFLVSSIYNESVRDLDVTSRRRITQEIDLNSFGALISGIGYQLEGGTLILKGRAKDFLADNMKDGKIVAEKVENYAGGNMEGGELEIVEAARDLGYRMVGGKITVRRAGRLVGYNRSGGEIHIEESYKNISENRSGGKVFFKGKEVG